MITDEMVEKVQRTLISSEPNATRKALEAIESDLLAQGMEKAAGLLDTTLADSDTIRAAAAQARK